MLLVAERAIANLRNNAEALSVAAFAGKSLTLVKNFMMKKQILKFSFVMLFLSSIHVFAWGLTGHRVIAEIAERHLSHRAKSQIKKLFGEEPMAYWANYPDFLKSDSTGIWKQADVWHYVNIVPQSNFGDFEKNLKAQTGPNLYTQCNVLAATLRDRKIPLADRKNALIFLVHLLGDSSQPMHTGRAEDLGGNKIEVTYFGEKANLHSVWDSKLVDSQKYSYTEFAQLLDVLPAEEVRKIQSGTLETWLYDSHKAANHIYYQTPTGSKLGYDYQYRFTSILERQLLYGGLRLAKFLNDVFA